MNSKPLSFLLIIALVLFATPFELAIADSIEDGASVEEKESALIELIRLELELECELSPNCREKNLDYTNKTKQEFKSYKKGTANSEAILKMKSGLKTVDIDPNR